MIMKHPLILASASVLALAACDPTLAPEEQQRTRSGATIGAIAGGITGAATGPGSNRFERAVIGAAAGAAIGGAIGQQLDRQARDLRQAVGNDNIGIVNTGSELVVTLPQDILFATDSAVVRPDLQRDLRAVAGNLQSYPDSTIQIVGHTDSTGSAAYNQGLSERRANSVANVLRNAGVSSARIAAFGMGEDRPVASNETAAGRALNRRVEIIIRPNA